MSADVDALRKMLERDGIQCRTSIGDHELMWTDKGGSDWCYHERIHGSPGAPWLKLIGCGPLDAYRLARGWELAR